MFQLMADAPTRCSFNRVDVLRAFLDRPAWSPRSVEKAWSLCYRDYWWRRGVEIPDDDMRVVETVIHEVKAWKKLDRLASAGSLKLALVRPLRRDRIEHLLVRLERHREWRIKKLKTMTGYKEYKTRNAWVKEHGRFKQVMADDAVLNRIERMLTKLRLEIHNWR